MLVFVLLFIPLFSAIIFVFLRKYRDALNIVASLFTFICAILIAWQVYEKHELVIGNHWFYVDYLNSVLLIITTLIGLTTAIFSIKYLANELRIRDLSRKKIRYYQSLYQFFIFTALFVLMTNNLGLLWVALECATLSTVLLVAIYRTPSSLEASWKYLILCGVGLAQALLGIILIYFSAENVLDVKDALFWTELRHASVHLSPTIISLSFVFILIGYGTKAGFVPLHNWLPDVYGESIAPVISLLSGILLNVAFYAILRIKLIVDGTMGSSFANSFLLGFGILNVLLSAFFLLRQREIKHLFAYSSIEHVGLISFAFGIGTPLAMLGGLLHMIGHALSKTAALFSAGQVIQLYKTSCIENIRDLINTQSSLGWGLLLNSLALLGLPPFVLFTSEFLIIFSAIKQHFWLTLLLVLGLMIAFGAILYHIQGMMFHPNNNKNIKIAKLSIFPIYFHLILIIALGLCMPLLLINWFDEIIKLLSDYS